ncbi:MAG: hypothetical protein Q7U52_02785 [Hydrogenophaga sp.]|nr:hypothetical protein [Hydrogenophaga sp.]MDO9146587.1 hypothetical protein [Hydrogenophaga sp.]MDO9606711.1 hypothetical protein [Hydrogenophaga sp.]MDP2163747.1 hypothetical protein [Hydrogenophaga sp.]MDP3475907.1 hypothetical protein [Hydrogenophaga sp.]
MPTSATLHPTAQAVGDVREICGPGSWRNVEFGKLSPVHKERQIDEGVDVVLARDIAEGGQGIRWARETFATQEIVYVAGNHALYGNNVDSLVVYRRWDGSAENRVFQTDLVIEIWERHHGDAGRKSTGPALRRRGAARDADSRGCARRPEAAGSGAAATPPHRTTAQVDDRRRVSGRRGQPVQAVS